MAPTPVIKTEPLDENTYSSILANYVKLQPVAGDKRRHTEGLDDEIIIKAERLENMIIDEIPIKRASKMRKLTKPSDDDVVLDVDEEEDVEAAFAAAKESASAKESTRYTSFPNTRLVPDDTGLQAAPKASGSRGLVWEKEESRLRIDGEQRLKCPDKDLVMYKGNFLRMAFATRIGPNRNPTPTPVAGSAIPKTTHERVTTQKKGESPMEFRRRKVAAEKKARARLDKVQSSPTSKARVEKSSVPKLNASKATRNSNEDYVQRGVACGSANVTGKDMGGITAGAPSVQSQRWSSRLVDRSRGRTATVSSSARTTGAGSKQEPPTKPRDSDDDNSDGGVSLFVQ